MSFIHYFRINILFYRIAIIIFNCISLFYKITIHFIIPVYGNTYIVVISR